MQSIKPYIPAVLLLLAFGLIAAYAHRNQPKVPLREHCATVERAVYVPCTTDADCEAKTGRLYREE